MLLFLIISYLIIALLIWLLFIGISDKIFNEIMISLLWFPLVVLFLVSIIWDYILEIKNGDFEEMDD